MSTRRHRSAPRSASPRARRGYTVIEVMMALAVLTLGASGVIAMQKATLISNTNARNLATANAIGQTWIERLRTDALSWNEAGGNQDLPTSTIWLNAVVNSTPAGGTGWATPAQSLPLGTQPAGMRVADVMGADLYPGVDPAGLASAFCTQLRMVRVSTATTGVLASFYKVIRVEVRVIWDRRSQPLNCAVLPAGFELDVGHYGVTYLVSAVMENSSPI
jgi:prepilin-type N-terminal cleavage/methylation domain-containing protein